MQITLNKPLVFIDLETTGVNVASDRIVEIALYKLNPNGSSESLCLKVNPTIPIPAESSAIHGIFDADVADQPTFAQIGKKVEQFIGNGDLAGYNSNKFDIPLLMEEFLRADIDFDLQKRKLVDVQNIFHKMEQRTLAAAYKFYCDKDLVNAHTAEADTMATYEVLMKQIEKYPTLQNDVAFLSEFSNVNKSADLMGRIVYNNNGNEVFNFGKHKGRLVEEIFKTEPSYYNWMMDGDFPLYTKRVITAIKLRLLNK